MRWKVIFVVFLWDGGGLRSRVVAGGLERREEIAKH